MVMISKYRLEYNRDEDVYYVLSDEKINCPICSCKHMRGKGRRKRGVIKTSGDKILLIIRRLLCGNCLKIHHELPSIIVPYKRHNTETIENILNNEYINVSCEESTISRIKSWWAVMQKYISAIVMSLNEKYQVEITAVQKLPQIVRALANTHLWPGTRSALTPGGV